MDISSFSTVDLKDLLQQIPAELKRREKEEKAALRKQLEEIAAEKGYSVSDIFGVATEKVAKDPVLPKYRSVSDPNLLWSGRGRQPVWVKTFIADGGKWEDITI